MRVYLNNNFGAKEMSITIDQFKSPTWYGTKVQRVAKVFVTTENAIVIYTSWITSLARFATSQNSCTLDSFSLTNLKNYKQ